MNTNNPQKDAEEYADQHGYKSDKEQHTTTPWTEWNIRHDAYLAAALRYSPGASASLIAALEQGLTLQKDYAVAFPDQYHYTEKGECVETLWMEVNNGNRYFYRHGWGSALGKTSDVVMEVLTNSERWTIVNK